MKKLRYLCLLLAVLLLSGCGAGSGDQPGYAPPESERLVVYTSHKEELWRPIVREFEERTGIWVDVVTGGSNELLERIASEADAPEADGMFGGGQEATNTERITLPTDDLEDILAFVPGVEEGCLSFTTTSTVDGGELEESASYTIAGVQSNYASLSNLELVLGEFLSEDDDTYKEKVCVLGYDAAREIFGSVYDAYNGTVYIDNRPYQVVGILNEMGTVSSGISPDSAIFIPYETGLKYLAGDNVSPTLTVISEDVNNVETVITNVETVLAESYPNAEFTISDAGSRMEAASASNDTLTMLLVCMAVIVFIVGGLGIMNVLFVSVKERTNEIGILKAIGCTKKDILAEFLMEASCTSLLGAILGAMLALGLTPALEYFGVTVSLSVSGGVLSLIFGVLTGTVFGFYPAYQASNLIPVEALNHE